MKDIATLEKLILQHRDIYYNETSYKDIQPISDAEYDLLVDKLSKLKPNSPAITMVGSSIPPSEWKEATHNIPMGSLNKVNTPEEFTDWNKYENLFVTEKLDGLSINCIYDDGKLVQAITRGDGTTGFDITCNVRKMNVPLTISNFTGSIRGEIIMKKSIHKQFFSDKANPRNAASGISKRLDGVGCNKLNILFYQVLGDIEFDTEVEQFEWLVKNNISTPNFWLFDSSDKVNDHWRDYQDNFRSSLDYDIDGLVIRINDMNKQISLGDINMRPKGAIAFKFDNESAETILEDIIWEVGSGGRVTPVAILKPVFVCGAEISRASLHNCSLFSDLKLFKYCRVLVSRRNDVIPYVEKNLDA